MQAQVRSFLPTLIGALPVTVKVRVRDGEPAFHIEGISETAAAKARARVHSAIPSSGFDFPEGHVKVTVQHPCDAPTGNTAGLDLAIAYSILLATKQVKRPRAKAAAVGELSFEGSTEPIRGLLPIANAAHQVGISVLALPAGNVNEARINRHPDLAPVRSLEDLRDLPIDHGELQHVVNPARVADLSELRGHKIPQRALEIAAAGGHSILFIGRPGSGNTMLARRLPGILPEMTREEALEVTHFKSIAGELRIDGLEENRPFRAPNHTIAKSGLLGGPTNPIPGEVTLAHNGVLFLDQLHDFSSATLTAFAAETRDRHVQVTKRIRGKDVTYELPANFQLVAATSPCACGSESESGCCCTQEGIARFQHHLATEVQDTIDIFCHVTRPTWQDVDAGPGTTSSEVRERTTRARERQLVRYENEDFRANGQLHGSATRFLLQIPDEPHELLNQLYRRNQLTLRGYDRILRIARTIADLADRDHVQMSDIEEALTFVNVPKVPANA